MKPDNWLDVVTWLGALIMVIIFLKFFLILV